MKKISEVIKKARSGAIRKVTLGKRTTYNIRKDKSRGKLIIKKKVKPPQRSEAHTLTSSIIRPLQIEDLNPKLLGGALSISFVHLNNRNKPIKNCTTFIQILREEHPYEKEARKNLEADQTRRGKIIRKKFDKTFRRSSGNFVAPKSDALMDFELSKKNFWGDPE